VAITKVLVSKVTEADQDSQISQNCSRSWTIHANFAGALLHDRLRRSDLLSAEQQHLHHFAFTYFVLHDVFAATAGSPRRPYEDQITTELCRQIHAPHILALTGCTKPLLVLISEISALGSFREAHLRQKRCDDSSNGDSLGDIPFWIGLRRDEVERQLHNLDVSIAGSSPPSALASELDTVLEVKRLAALLYLYGRFDGMGPQEPQVVRTTRRVLGLVRVVSLRTNALLWPLFVVGTLGVPTETETGEEDRRLVLDTLAALQERRQLGNVKKARCVIEEVWKARDLHPSHARMGWTILDGRYDAISLA